MNEMQTPRQNELYHHGVMGMHWGIRRFQPYRKGDEVRGGREVGKATKVEQRSIADRVKKGIAAVNKIKKEIQKGRETKAEHKVKMAQLKAAKKEVKKAERREKEERIRERIREHREEERMERQEAEERRERNFERARSIVNDAAQIGTMLYGAYQLKQGLKRSGALGNDNSSAPAHVPTETHSAGTSHNAGTSSSSSSPHVTTSASSGSSGSLASHISGHLNSSSHSTPSLNSMVNQINSSGTAINSHGSSSSSSATSSSAPTSRLARLRQSIRDSRDANRSLTGHNQNRQDTLDQNYRRSADRNSQIVGLQSAIAQARLNADDSHNGHRSAASQQRLDRLDALAGRARSAMNREISLTANTDAVANQYRQNATAAGRRAQRVADGESAIARASGMTPTQYRNASRKERLKAMAKFLSGSGAAKNNEQLNNDLLDRMRGLQSSGNGASQAEINDIRRELERLTASHSMSSRDELYHYGGKFRGGRKTTKKRSK